MRNQKYENVYAVRIDKGEEIVEKLKELCRTENIRFAQVSAIGASEHAVLGVYDLAKQEYAREAISCFCEITSLTGNITTDQQHQIHGGHVLELTVGATCEIFIRVIDATVGRIHNDQMGINLWDI